MTPDKKTKFHEFALKSILFKGRPDWYFCYLKSERITHVLALLSQNAPNSDLDELVMRAAGLPGDIAHLSAGELAAPLVLADVFGLLSAVRTAGVRGMIHPDTAGVLAREYEQVAERLVAGSHPSPFASVEDFVVMDIPDQVQNLGASAPSPVLYIKDRIKDVPAGIKDDKGQKSPNRRTSLILEFVLSHKRASIKDIAATIKGCSEKTIQRELAMLVEQGLVKKIGERRWSVYVPA